SPVLALPPLSQNGIYLLRVTVISPTGQLVQDVCLVVCRDRAYQGDRTAPRRMWALGVQLYGVRSRRNWGHGDFTDLAALIDLAADLGAAGATRCTPCLMHRRRMPALMPRTAASFSTRSTST